MKERVDAWSARYRLLGQGAPESAQEYVGWGDRVMALRRVFGGLDARVKSIGKTPWAAVPSA